MTDLRRILLLTASCLSMTFAMGQTHGLTTKKLEPETLHYRVMFKWGLLNKKAGTATLRLNHDKKTYTSQLSAKSEPWADRIFCVRDTLNGKMSYDGFTPLFYEKIANEGNEHKHDIVKYDYNDSPTIKALCSRKVYKKGILKIDENKEMSAENRAVDMLTSFYFMRTLPYEDWKPGHIEDIDIFSGKRKELLSIVYAGKVNIDINGAERTAYRITFKFTSGGGKKTSDDMEAWISADSERIPLRLEGKLPVGKVHCILEE